MLDLLIKFSLKNRLFVVVMAVVVLVYGGFSLQGLPIDVFPDLNKPTVTVMTEGHGMAPEEVEQKITIPLENVLNGLPGVTRVRSNSGIGLSIIYVEFEWGSDIYRNRQLVAEKITEIKESLGKDIIPMIGAISSIMGEIQLVGLTFNEEGEKNQLNPVELRTFADWVIKPRLQAIPGVSLVTTMGGGVKEFQILIDSKKLNFYQLELEEVEHKLEHIGQNSTGGYSEQEGKEYLIRHLGMARELKDIEETIVGNHLGKYVYVKDIAKVQIGPKVKRGDAGVLGKKGVILSIQKQPGASTIELSKKIDSVLSEIQKDLPLGYSLQKDLFKQSDFIEHSISNVNEALRDATIFITIVLFLFLMNFRTTIITLTAIPLSFVLTFIVFKFFDMSINTMTLGGLAIAIGELVDDAIVDVENVLRRLRENANNGYPKTILRTIYEASSEVRNSIVFATIIVILVFIPLFFMQGLEGRLFLPLGISYVISLIASLVVSLTVTPVLCSLFLKDAKFLEEKDGKFVLLLKNFDRKVLSWALDHGRLVLGFTAFLFVVSMVLLPFLGRDFLPKFNEGTAVISLQSEPGISLADSDRIGSLAEKEILSIPEVKSVSRRTGRAEQDEHAEGVHSSEIDVDFKEKGRSREIVLEEIRNKLSQFQGTVVNIGQPISHRLDHLLSGVRAEIAVKIFGPDLSVIRKKAYELKNALDKKEGVYKEFLDLQVEQMTLIPQIKVVINRENINTYGVASGDVTEFLEKTLNGEVVGVIQEGQKFFNIFMRFDDASKKDLSSIENIHFKTMPNGQKIKISDIADIFETNGPNIINRENSMRRIYISMNLGNLSLDQAKKIIEKEVANIQLKPGYYVQYDGQIVEQEKGSKLMYVLGILSIVGIFVVLLMHFKSSMISLQVMINIPLALIGSVFAIYFTKGTLSLASVVAFITLCGIASRNGIMMISHYLHLMKYEGEGFSREMIIRGSLERLVPVLMTAFTAVLALLPILFSEGEPGKEILYPLSVVIVGGLLSSTLLDIVVTPTFFYMFGEKSALKNINSEQFNDDL